MGRHHGSPEQPPRCTVDDEWADLVERIPDPVDAVYDDEGLPGSWDSPSLSDAELLEGRGVVSEWDLPLLASIDPAGLDDRWAQRDSLRRTEVARARLGGCP
jgi:hypothetical protein